jgi:hypothetical protein
MMFGVRKGLCACAAMLLCWATVCADDVAPAGKSAWRGSHLARVEALALLQTLNHRLASPPRVVAERVKGIDKSPSPEQRRQLGVTPTEPVRYRRVRLLCGTVVLSEADNWYVPGRLTAEMNTQLDTTDLPFGKVVQALHFQRHTLSSKLLWLPLPEGWEMNSTSKGEATTKLLVPAQVLEHRAVLTLPDGTPFSEVVETYTNNVLAFPEPTP